jgi:pimeloyl-ACP methyl ester carboxylesterase
MMPFSVLRTWFGGLLGWVVLGVAVYTLWEWADGVDPLPGSREVLEPQTGEVTIANPPVQHLDKEGGWPYLAIGIGCLALSFGGMFPVTLFLGKPGRWKARRTPSGREIRIDRPDGSRLHVEILGKEDGPTLLFTHGWSLESSVWNELVDNLGRRYRIIVWDLAGLGRSKGPTNGDFSLEKMAGDLAAVAENSGKGALILVGHSIGGMIAQTFCRLHAKQLGTVVAGIVLLHTTYTNPLRTALGRTFWKAIEQPILVPLNYVTIWLAPLAWLSNVQSYLSGSLHILTRIASFSGRQTWGQLDHGAWLAAKAWPATIARGNLAMLEFDEQNKLPFVDIPVLIIAANHDRMTCPDASERLAELLPHSMEAAVDGGHLGFWEQPEKVCELIAEFAERTTAASEIKATTLSEEKPPVRAG